MLIHRLKVSGLLSFGPTGIDLPLEPLNVLIGPNGSGKSNLLEILALLRAAPTRLSAPIKELGGIEGWLWKGPGSSKTARIETFVNSANSGPPVLSSTTNIQNHGGRFKVYSEPPPLRHTINIENHGGRLEVTDECIKDDLIHANTSVDDFYYLFRAGRPTLYSSSGERRILKPENLKLEESILSQVRDPETYRALYWLQKHYEEIVLYRNWFFGPQAAWRKASSFHVRSDQLVEDTSNLPHAVSEVRLKNKQALIESLQVLMEDVQDVQTHPVEGGLQIFLEEGAGRQIPAARLSDGTLRYLALLTILHHPTPPPLVAIEEPELGLHPDVIPHISELLVEASKRTQLVITTHSRLLIDSLTDYPSSVVVCGKEKGESVFERIDGERLRAWLNDYSLGELWSMGELGGNRW